MSCRTSAAGSAWTTFARLESGLSDVQTLSTFHALRRDGRGQDRPSPQEWAEFVAAQRTEMEAAGFSAARIRSLNRRMDLAADELPDGPTWHALRNIRRRAAIESSNVEATLRTFATRMGEDYDTVRARFDSYAGEVDRSRSAAPPEGYQEYRDTLHQEGLPVDRGTFHAYMRLAREVEQAVTEQAPPRRITPVSFPNSAAVAHAGYDPHDGRLEVTFRRSGGGTSRTYAYRGVPPEVWAAMCGEEGPGGVYNREVRNRSQYRYATREEEEAGAHRRCTGCGQWWAPGHACPVPAEGEPVSTRVPEGRERTAAEHAAVGAAVTQILAEAAAEDQSPAEADPVEPADPADPEVAAAIADLRARLTDTDPAPEPEQASEPVSSGRPAPVPLYMQGVYSRYRYLNQRRGQMNPGYYDYAHIPPASQVRPLVATQPVIIDVEYSGRRWLPRNTTTSTDGLPEGYFHVTGAVVFDRPARGQWEVTPRQLQCTCAEYQANYRCPHIDMVLDRYREHLVPRRTANRTTVAEAQSAAEEALRADWMRSQEHAAEARARHAAASNPEDSYTDNYAAFEADHDAALARKRAGEPPVPYMTSNALGGEFTRESGRGFGVELEFDFPPEMSIYDREAALRTIGRELFDAGLTFDPAQQGYGTAGARGFIDTHEQGWCFEEDCTVSGEIVSPVMYDEPQTWANIDKVCQIVQRNGGIANVRTGSHVHVGAPHMTTEVATELMQMSNQHEDSLFRFSQNPDKAAHRPLKWCAPNEDVPHGGYQTMYDVGRISSHGYGINYGGVNGNRLDHPEIRYWDGTLNPAVIQTQIKISTAMVQAAERNAGLGMSQRGREPLGSHHTRLKAIRNRSRRALTTEEKAEDTATTRSFIDTLFTRREDKAQAAALFAVTKWQTPRLLSEEHQRRVDDGTDRYYPRRLVA